MRKLTAMVLLGALSLGTLAPTALADDHKGKSKRPKYEEDYKDWEDDFWANESLARMITRGVIQGNGDATIASQRPVTRLEAVIMMTRLLELEAPEMPYGEFTIKTSWGEIRVKNKKDEFEIKIKTKDGEWEFEDDGEIPDWGRAAILTGLKEGFLIFDGSSISPMRPLNRLEAAIMMVKAAGLDAEAQARAGADLDFKDENKIPERLRGYIALAVESGFVTGYEDGTFRPTQILTRAEWAALLDRLDRRNGPPVTSDGRQIKATVTDVDDDSSPSLSVTTPVYPGGVTYPLDETYVVYKSGKEIDLDEIQSDDQVIINLDGEREILLITVTNVARQVNGKVEDFVSPTSSRTGSIRLNENGKSKTYTVTRDTKVLVGNREADFDDVKDGDLVTLKVEGTRATQIAIKAEAVTVTGTLEAVNFGSNSALPTLKIKSENNVRSTYSVADHATIKAANGAEITLADLNVGDVLTLKVERDLITAIQVKSSPAKITSGLVEEFRSPTSTATGKIVVSANGKSATYTVTKDTDVLLGTRAGDFADIREGDQVSLRLNGNSVTQIAIKVESVTLTATLEAVDFGSDSELPSLKVKANNLRTTYSVADHATIKAANGTEITLEDLTVGDVLTLKVERDLITAIQVKSSPVRTMTGKVEEFTSPTRTAAGEITVDVQGDSATFSVASTTEVLLAGKKSTFAEVREGDSVTIKVQGDSVTQIAIKVETVTVSGSLEEIDFGDDDTLPTIEIKGSNNVRTTYSIADHATIKAANGKAITLEDLDLGDKLTVKVERNRIISIQVRP